MSQNAPGRKTTDLGPNPSGRTQGAPELRASVPGEYDHEGGHPERIRRRKEFASCDRSAQLPLFLELGNALLFITIDGRWDTLSMKAKRLIKGGQHFSLKKGLV
jgi:hypothetical protein